MPPSPDAALFARLVAQASPPPTTTELVLDLTEEVEAVTRLLREATQLLQGAPGSGQAAVSGAEHAQQLATLLLAAQEAAQRQAEGTAALLRRLSLGNRAA
jgi:hypothetical protein